MKKFKDKLIKKNSQGLMQVYNVDGPGPAVDWTKYDERLLECAEVGDADKLRSLLAKKSERGLSPVKLSPEGTTPLHTACEKGYLECVDVLLEEYPDLSVVDKSGCSALHVAARAGHSDCIARVLCHKVHVGSQDGRKMTALHHAAARGYKDCVELLLNNGAPLNVKDKDGRTPLLMGIQSAHEDVVQLLLEKGSKVNIVDNSNKTALMYACLLGLTKCVSLLLKRGANSHLLDNNGHTAEAFARLSGYKEIIAQIQSAPTVAMWDAGEDTEQETDTETSNGELISSFNGHDESDHTSVASSHTTTVTDHSAGTSNLVYNGRVSLQDSFSSKASTSISSPRLASDRDHNMSIDITELEEENEMLNQELNKLRIQHQKTLGKLHSIEAEQKEKFKNSTSSYTNGYLEEELLEQKSKKVKELELRVTNLQEDLRKELDAKTDAEDEIETLKAQLASYQDEGSGELPFSDAEDDFDLPGIDGSKKSNKLDKNCNHERLMTLNTQLTTLKLENERLKEKLTLERDDSLHEVDDVPTIPLTAHQQIQETSEEEIFRLNEEVAELRIQNQELEQEVMAAKSSPCQKCLESQQRSSVESTTEQHTQEIQQLKQQLQEMKTKHKTTVNTYRLHLLSAVQGELDSEVEEALQMIVKLRSSEQFC